MRRLMIQPRFFGTVNGYEWTATNPPEPHHDYCQLYSNEYSVRLWEPSRLVTSTPGIVDPGAGYEAPPMPVKAHIRGIKGNAYIRFDGTDDGVGTWLDDTGTPWAPQPSAQDTYNALAGMPRQPGLGTFETFNPIYDLYADRDRNPATMIPLFIALYRGTYKQVDDAPGWEIDSGPGDDPDTLLAMDITDPSVLESSRLDWWDMDMVPAPRASGFTPLTEDGVFHGVPERPDRGSMHRYAVNLDANKRVSSDQVLWLHFKTGVIRLPCVRPGAVGGGDPTLECGLYVNHKFTFSITASMLVDTKVDVG